MEKHLPECCTIRVLSRPLSLPFLTIIFLGAILIRWLLEWYFSEQCTRCWRQWALDNRTRAAEALASLAGRRSAAARADALSTKILNSTIRKAASTTSALLVIDLFILDWFW